MNKFIELEDTFFNNTKIVSFNIDSIDYIEKSSSKRITIGYKGITKYYVDASLKNLAKMYIDKLISYEFIDLNYREKSFDVNQYIYSSEYIAEYIEKRGVKRNDIRRHKK